ncbi:unnamed protein product [Enterobius vermicularis]|uniref:WD_REPEATS_REGION domain-containing protein n=1 Tax=Enterobius vermicularis TaxID=51028 RepID=A0A0N4VHQ4_ENTVE|nr:unnamed protein product [Enterobius vermicularis]
MVMARRVKHARPRRSVSGVTSGVPPFENLCTEEHGHKIYGCCFCPYSRETLYFATVGHNRVTVYKINDDENLELLRCYQDAAGDELFYTVCWAYDPDYEEHSVVVGGQRGIVRVLEATTGNVICSLSGHGGAVNDIKVCPKDSTLIATAGEDFTARIWDTRNESCLAILGGSILFQDFDASCDYLATASMDHTVKMWYIGEGSGVDRMIAQAKSSLKLIDMPLEIHYPYCSTRDIHADYADCVCIYHKMIFSKSVENKIVLWKFGDLESGVAGGGTAVKTESSVLHFRQLFLPDGDLWFVRCTIDPSGKYLACGNKAAAIHVWDLSNGMPANKRDFVLLPKGMKGAVRQLSFSPCSRYLVAVGDDGCVSVFVNRHD